MLEVLLTKLMPPEAETGLLERARLFNMVTPGKEKKVTVVTAPAGYGKTVLVLQLSRLWGKPLVWYHLDSLDNDPAVFLQYLVTGIQQHCPGVGRRALNNTVTEGNAASRRRFLVSTLVNDLIRARSELLLVLDDYHELSEPAVQDLVQDLLENLPTGMHTVIAGRTELPFSTARLAASGTLQHIGAEDLIFTRREIRDYLEMRYKSVPASLLDKMESKTAGWAAALKLAAMHLPERETPGVKEEALSSREIYAYLASEILDRQTPEIRDFLLGTSVLDVLTPRICDSLLERSDSSLLLKILFKRQMLLIPLAGREKAFRYHVLFRDFLRERLGHRSGPLLRKAGRYALALGELEHASSYFLQAGFDQEAAGVLQKAGRQAFCHGRWETVSRWLEGLTEEQIAENPWFSFFQAKVETYRGRLEEADRRAGWAAAGFEASGEAAGLIETLLLQARIMRVRGNYRQGLEMLGKARSRMSEQEKRTRFDLPLEEGLGLAMIGDLPRAEKAVSAALEDVKKSGDAAAAAHLAEALGHILYQQGEHARALKTYRQAMETTAGRSLPGYYMQDTIPYIYCDWGELEKALEWAQQSVAAKEKHRFLETLHSAYTCISYIYFELNDFAMVEKYTVKALELMQSYGQERYFLLLNRVILAWCRYAGGRWAEARDILEDVLAAAEEQEDMIAPLVRMMGGTVMALMGSTAEAKTLLHLAEESMKKMNLRLRLCEAYKALAYVYHVEGDERQFQKYAHKYIRLAARLNFVCSSLVPTSVLLKPILRFGIEEGIEVAFLQRILVKLGRRAADILLEMARHPDPEVRYRTVVPLAEIGGEDVVMTINTLSRDNALRVRQAAVSSLRLPFTASAADHPGLSLSPALSEAPLQVKTLGFFQVFVEGKEVIRWRTRKARDLLALLVHLQEPVARDRILEELWPEAAPEQGAQLFRANLYYLRRLLEKRDRPPLILYGDGRYRLREGSFNADFQLFEQSVNAGLQCPSPGEREINRLEKAVQLYRGYYMEGLEDYTWVIPRQFRLKQLYIEALLVLARYYFTRKIYPGAEQHLLKIKEMEPLHEQAHCLLLKVYARLGNYQALHSQHQSFRQLFVEELGLSPSSETETLFRKLCCSR